jgi:hypothetical protein
LSVTLFTHPREYANRLALAGTGKRRSMTPTDRAQAAQTTGDGREETPMERLDRNLEELTGELRVVVTGVQVLFAFLLVVPFNTGFAHVGGFERTVYFVTLLLAMLAAVCTIAPSAQHRFLFRHDDKRNLVFVSNRIVIAGLAFLALAMCGCLLLAATKLFGTSAGILTVILSAVPFALLWFAPSPHTGRGRPPRWTHRSSLSSLLRSWSESESSRPVSSSSGGP